MPALGILFLKGDHSLARQLHIRGMHMKLLTPVGLNRCNGGHLFEKKRLKGRFFFIPLMRLQLSRVWNRVVS
ncbi:MAG: hypothetical protein A3K90_07270 [Pelodictyon luteolum]|uniref:Uncharacterized protein n=1 Tax=Pelodictyon luteolum TaxID=1100 RepID=A0A165LGJ7_PELLU|nr:MAG: hypothetical protein A3K90_07270 [Pelodictyon luteolum]